MADYSNYNPAEWDAQAANPAQPAGLSQTQGSVIQSTGRWAQDFQGLQPWSPPSWADASQQWYGGRNLTSPENGWSTPFMKKALAQQNTYMDRAAESGRSSTFFDWLDTSKNKDATGVALWDDPKRGIKRGDVFEDGVKRPNLYKSQGGLYDDKDADVLMGAFMFDGRQQASMFADKNPQQRLRQAVEQKVDEWSDWAQHGETAEIFDQGVKDTNRSIREAWGGAKDDVLALGTGALAGGAAAATTTALAAGAASALGFAWTGPGALVAGAIGATIAGTAAWLNRDQVTQIAARGWEIADKSKQQHGMLAGSLSALEQVSGLASIGMSPVSNIAQGIYDGADGDGVSDYYELDSQGKSKPGFWMKTTNLTSMVGDAFLQFSSPVAAGMYMATMGGHTVGKAGGFLLTDSVWSDSQGQFRDMEDWKERTAAWGSVGIDLVQLGIAGAMTKAAANSRRVFATPTTGEIEVAEGFVRPITIGRPIGQNKTTLLERKADQAWGRLRGRSAEIEGATARTINGIRFFVGADQKVITSRLTMQVVAPSEFLRWLPTGYRARTMVANDRGLPGVDDLYRAALEMTSTGSRFGQGLIAAFGEGAEEFTQGWLDPISRGEDADWGVILNQTLMGAATGFGMGTARMTQGAANKQIERFRAEMLYRGRNAAWEMSSEDFNRLYDSMSKEERRKMSIAHTAEAEEFQGILKTMEDWHTHTVDGESPIGIYGGQEMRLDNFEAMQRNANPNIDGSLVLRQMSNDKLLRADGQFGQTAYAPNAAVMSAFQTVDSINRIGLGLQVQTTSLAQERAGAERALETATTARDQHEIERLQTVLKDIADRENDLKGQMEVSDAITAWFRQQYDLFAGTTDRAAAENILDQMNEALRSAWKGEWNDPNGRPLPDHLVRRAVELKLGRHPFIDAGSFGVLLPQISKGLTWRNAHGQVYVHQGILKAPNADFDGDTKVTLNTTYLPPAEIATLRRGAQYMQEVDVLADPDDPKSQRSKRWRAVMDAPDNEASFISSFAKEKVDKSTKTYDNVRAGLLELNSAIYDRYWRNSRALPRDALLDAQQKFEDAVWAGNKDARIDLINDLFNLDSNSHTALMLLGEKNNLPEMHWITNQVSLAWDNIQRNNAALNFADEAQANPLPPARQQSDRAWLQARSTRDAASLASTISQLFGVDPTRAAQHMHYTAFLHAAVLTHGVEDSGWVEQRAKDLSEAYSLMGSGETRSDMDRIVGRNSIEDRVLMWLSKMAKSVEGAHSIPQTMLVLANTAVRDIEVKGPNDYVIHDGTVSLLQMLLRKSLQVEEFNQKEALKDSPIKKKINRLKRLTGPQSEHSYSASEAMLEIFGGFQLHDLLGEDSQFLGPHLTLNQLRMMVDGKHERNREKDFEYWKGPAYKHPKGLKDAPYDAEVYQKGLVNGYTAVVDSLIATARTNYKALKAQDATDHDEIIVGFTAIRKILDDWRKHFGQKLTEPGVRVTDEDLLKDILVNHPEIAEHIAALIPNASRMGTFVVDDGITYTAPWVEKMLLAESPERAAAIYNVHSKLDEWFALQGKQIDPEEEQDDGAQVINGVRYGRIKSRFLQTMYHLASRPDHFELNRFLTAAANAPTVEKLYDQINVEPMWRGDREKLLPWHDDVALFESDPKDVWAANLPGALQRENLKGWGDRLAMMGEAAVAAVANREREDILLESMHQVLKHQEDVKQAQRTGRPIPPTPVFEHNAGLYLSQFVKSIENAARFPDALGPVARMQLVEAIQGALVQMHNKGSADRRVAPAGESLVTSDTYGVKQGVFMELDTISTIDFNDVRSNLTKLAEGPVRIMMPDGGNIDVNFSDTRQALDMYRDPRTRALAKAVIFPTVRDVNPNNVLQIYQDADDPSDFVQLLEDASFVRLLNGGSRPSLRNALRYIGLIESYVRKDAQTGTEEEKKKAFFPVQNMIDDFIVAYSHGPGAETVDDEALRTFLFIEVAYAIQQAAKVAPKKLENLQRLITDAMYDRTKQDDSLDRLFLSDMEARLVDSTLRGQWLEMYQERLIEIDDELTRPGTTLTLVREQELDNEKRAIAEGISQLGDPDVLTLPKRMRKDMRAILRAYKVDHGQPGSDDTKDKIVHFMRTGNRLNMFRTKKTMELIHRVRHLDDKNKAQRYDRDYITDDEWDILTGWAAGAFKSEEHTRSGSNVDILPPTIDESSQVNKYYDDTWAYLAAPLFDENILEAARVIKIRALDNGDVTDNDLKDILMSGLLSDRRLGEWSNRVPVDSMATRKILEAASVGLTIPVAGIDPKTLADYVGNGWVSFAQPLPEHMSTTDISGVAGQRIMDILRPVPQQYTKLQNHFVSKLALTATDINGDPFTMDLMDAVGLQDFNHDSVRNSPYRVLHLDVLQEWLDKLMAQNRLTDFKVDIEYVDVDKKPYTAQYTNSIFFDGVGRQSEASAGAGPIAAMVFALWGLSKIGQQNPLDVLTKGGSAFSLHVTSHLAWTEDMERSATSVTDLMDRKARRLWGIDYGDTGRLLSSDLPGLHKMVKMRHLVKGPDINGDPKLMWAEEVIWLESIGKAAPYGQYRIIPISDKVARTLFGASGAQGVTAAMTDPVLNLQDMDPFPQLDGARLKRLGLTSLGERANPANSGLAQISSLPRASMADVKGAEIKSRYRERIERWRHKAMEVTKARTSNHRSGVANFDIVRMSKRNARQVGRQIASETMVSFMHRMNVPYANMQDLGRLQLGRQLAQNIKKMMADDVGIVWQYIQDADYNLANGIFTEINIDNGFSKVPEHGLPIYGDVVSIDLGSIMRATGGDRRAAFKQAKKVITAFADRGASIVLGSETGLQYLRSDVAEWIREGAIGYMPVGGGTHFFSPIKDETDEGRTIRALNSADTAVKVFNAKGATLNMITRWMGTSLSENSSHIDWKSDPTWRRMSTVILPTSLTAATSGHRRTRYAFNIPVPGSNGLDMQADAAHELLKLLRTDEGTKFLLDQMRGEAAEPDPVGINKYRENSNGTVDPGVRSAEDALKVLKDQLEANAWPLDIGNVLMAGDIVPLVDMNGNILLTRVGYKVPGQMEISRQMDAAVPMASGSELPRAKVAAARPELEPGQNVPPPFRIESTYPDQIRGLTIRGTYELSPLAKQIWEGAGFKAGLTLLPNGMSFPTRPMADGARKKSNNKISVTQITSEAAAIGKGATEGLVDNFGNAFAVFGSDFREYVVNFLFGSSPADPDAFDALWNDARLVLDSWAGVDRNLTSEQIKLGLDAGTFFHYAQEELNQLVGVVLPNRAFGDLSLATPAGAMADVNKDAFILLLSVLAAPGVKVDDVIRTQGLLTVDDVDSNAEIIVMPTLFTDALANPEYSDLRNDLIRRMNADMPMFELADLPDYTAETVPRDPVTNKPVTALIGTPRMDWLGKPMYKIDERFQFYAAINDNGQIRWEPTTLQIILPVPASENSVSYVQSAIASERQDITQHIANVINAAIGGRVAVAPLQKTDKKTGELIPLGPSRIEQLYGKNDVPRFGPGSGASLWSALTNIQDKDPSYSPWERLLPLQAQQVDESAAKVRQYRRIIQKDEWLKDKRILVDGAVKQLLEKLNFPENMRNEVDYLVRQFLGRPGASKDQEDYVEQINADIYLQALEAIRDNVTAYMNPLHGGAVPIPHMFFWERLFKAQEGVTNPWRPLAKDGRKKVQAKEWYDWVNTLIGQVLTSNTEFHSMFQDDLDGFWQSYQGATPALGSQQLSMDQMKSLKMMDGPTNDMILSMNPNHNAVLHDPVILASRKMTFDALVGHDSVFSSNDMREAYNSDLREQLDRQKKWLAGKKIPKQEKTPFKEYAKEGAFYAESVATSNALLRNAVNLSIIMRLANPALYASALLEVPYRNAFEHITSILTGQQLGKSGELIAKASEKLSEMKIGEAKVGEALNWHTKMSSHEIALMNKLAKQLGRSDKWRAVLYDEMVYQNLVEGNPERARTISKILERTAAFTAQATSDPKFGMAQTSVALRYLTAAWETLSLTNNAITVEQFVDFMTHDPNWLKNEFSEQGVNPHRMGMNRVAHVRSTKHSTFGKVLTKGMDSLCTSDNMAANFSGHLLKIPFLFTRFNVSALTTVTGLAGFDQAAAMFFGGRRPPKFLARAKAQFFGGDYDYDNEQRRWDTSDIIETLDLQRTFIRSGATMTMLMYLGMMAGNLGLGGDDEEARRRKRLAKYLNIPYFLNPMEAANQFTYKDAIFLDSVPLLDGIFQDATGHSAVVPHWIMRQFTSPIIGMQRFFETGDARELSHGFLDAFTAVPNSVARIWDSADMTAKLLAEQAQSEGLEGTIEAQSTKTQLLVNIVSVYEKALFENAFVNTIRNGSDKYDRNPYLTPMTAEENTGELDRTQGSNLPEQTDAMAAYRDDAGEIKQSYLTRTGLEGNMFQYAENNTTFSLVMSLFSGLGNSPYLRRNMVVKEQKIHMPETEKAKAEALILAAYQGSGGQQQLTLDEITRKLKQRDQDADIFWNQTDIEAEAMAIYRASAGIDPLSTITPEGQEVLTKAGADSVLTSLKNGAVRLGDASLQGISISQEMRDEIAEEWMTDLIQEGVDLGLGQEAASYRANRFWYGDPTNTDVPGLKWIIYDKKIPSSNVVAYNQLNTTYVIGPDGKPWATPFKRQNVLQAIGVPLPQTTWTAGQGLSLEAGTGKIIDEVLGINTGLHALERKQTESDIKATDKPLEDAVAKKYAPGETGTARKPFTPFTRFPSRGFTSGGGGSGGFFQRMQPLPGGTGARLDDIQFINTNTPYIRRARVERERVTSERGRLKQWQ